MCNADVAIQKPPTCLALHELSGGLDTTALMVPGTTNSPKKILDSTQKA